MKIKLVISSVLLTMVASASEVCNHVLWYDHAASDDLQGWENQSLPIGNGWFGVSVFGGVGRERLQVTENSILTYNNLTSALDLRFEFLGHNRRPFSGYRRELELETGIARTRYTVDGVTCTRECFASYPDRVMVVKFSTDQPKRLGIYFEIEVPNQRQFGRGRERRLGKTAQVKAEGTALEATEHLQHYNIHVGARAALKTDGRVETLDHSLEVREATEVVVVFSIGTNYRLKPQTFFVAGGEHSGESLQSRLDDADPLPAVRARVDAALAKGYDALKARHLADFSGLMNRCQVTLPGADATEDRKLTTDKLLARVRDGHPSTYLEETYFQFGRYLLVSSSRPGTLPANLQGIWTAHDKSPWGSGYWHNINVQMNYWPAFSCNLAECFQAYADFNAAFRPVTRPLAVNYLRHHQLGPLPADGEAQDMWCVGTAVYPYVVCGGPGSHSGPGTGGLTTKLFADWWDFTRDTEALKKYGWPTIHGMAEFLTRCVTETNGLFLSKFSASPEQFDTRPGRHGYYTTVGCAFDQQLIWENGNDLLRFAEILGVDDEVVRTVRRQLDRYDPVQIGESGQLKEFREERKYGEIGERQHRHISHLVGLYPGTLINKQHPDWMAAAKVSLTLRGDESTGWALAHRLNCWARLGDGDHCLLLLRNLLGKRTYANLWDMHPPFQIDGNFGATSGMAEMLLQSHAGYIDLLPALPKAWAARGSFRGLCARGAFEVDCDWQDGCPTRVVVRSKKGLKSEVRFAGQSCPFEHCPAHGVTH